MDLTDRSIKENNWLNIIFFSVTTAVAVAGVPYYLFRFGISAPEISLFVFYLLATGLSITAGYHRLFSHATYKANTFVEFLFLFFGAAAFEMSALGWSSQHRDHHRYVDTDKDPYSIKKGFFYAHIGWLVFWKHPSHLENSKDLQKNPLVMHQHNYYLLWAIVSGILTPLAVGALTGHLLGAFLFSICLRLTLVYHSTFAINSVCHMFGKATYDIHASARDHWLVALLTNGEGYHNFHHRFPGDYRNGIRWYHWDPSKWLIYFLSLIGFSKDLKRVSDFRILEARLAAEHQLAYDSLTRFFGISEIPAKILESFQGQYAKVKGYLSVWDHAAKEYQVFARQRMSVYSKELRKKAYGKIKEAKSYFYEAYERWSRLVEMPPSQLRKLLNNSLSSL